LGQRRPSHPPRCVGTWHWAYPSQQWHSVRSAVAFSSTTWSWVQALTNPTGNLHLLRIQFSYSRSTQVLVSWIEQFHCLLVMPALSLPRSPSDPYTRTPAQIDCPLSYSMHVYFGKVLGSEASNLMVYAYILLFNHCRQPSFTSQNHTPISPALKDYSMPLIRPSILACEAQICSSTAFGVLAAWPIVPTTTELLLERMKTVYPQLPVLDMPKVYAMGFKMMTSCI
jgi:hypothetical protein